MRLSADLSVCIVSYNCRDLLAECLRSIDRHKGHLSVEVVVVDNASGDGTVEMLESEFTDVVSIASEENLGFAGGTNLAVKHASADTLLLLNPDTEVGEGTLERLAEFVRTHPEVGAAGPAVRGPDGRLQHTCHAFPRLWLTLVRQLGLHRAFPQSRVFGAYDMTWWDHSEARNVDWLSGVCFATTRTVWERVGPLDEGYFMYAEDVDWCYR
ncbi:MAG: glycosyltransferase family 2 protein, partial [Armatimonadota bacterium]